MDYRIGLDIGITSIGWAVLPVDSNNKPYKILDLGVRIFDKPENPKNGSSLALPRREARSARRRLRRHKHRRERAKYLFLQHQIINKEELENLYSSASPLPDIYKVRYEALDRVLSNEELVRLLIHLLQRRGFKSNRKTERKDDDAGKLIAAVETNTQKMKEKGYRTIGEMLYLDSSYELKKRNRQGDYSNTFPRELLIDEIQKIFEAQESLGNNLLSKDFSEAYMKIFMGQRSFDKGPGENSPYAGNQIEKMLGNCTFEKDKKRAPKATYTFERFLLLNKINNQRLKDSVTGLREFTQEEKNQLIEYAYQKNSVSYTDVRKKLNIPPTTIFAGLPYSRKDIQEIEKTKFIELTAYHSVRKALDKLEKGYILKLSHDQLDAIGYALTVYKNDNQIIEHLTKHGISKEAIESLLDLTFRTVGNLSIEAMRKIIPLLEKGLTYDKACSQVYQDFRAHSIKEKSVHLPPIDYSSITNPVVIRALSQSTKLINAIISKYGSPISIHIELARDISKNFVERRQLEKSMNDNNARNEKIRQRLISDFKILNPTGQDIVKLKLFEEQDGFCLYSQEKMDINKVFFDTGYADIDHIIPYSISFNDSYNNKVLVKSTSNRNKGNRLPYEYFGHNQQKWTKFESLIETLNIPYVKKQYLLKQNIGEDEREEFKERNINDTRYITKAIANHIKDNLSFNREDDENLPKKRVYTINGATTAYMRKRWGLTKIREHDDLHHALDAVTIAAIDGRIIQNVARYHQNKELRFLRDGFIVDPETGEIIDKKEYDQRFLEQMLKSFPEPWPAFRKETEARLMNNINDVIHSMRLSTYSSSEKIDPIFVSRMPKRSISGPAHKETIRNPIGLDNGYSVSRVEIQNLKLSKDGEIENYYQPERDPILYAALKAQLSRHNGDGKLAFNEPFYKPLPGGTLGNIVKKVKIFETANLGVMINNGKGFAHNGDMIRIDVFHHSSGYYFVPIYVSDAVKSELPNKAVIANKKYDEWKEMVEGYDFLFSLYPNDLLFFKHKQTVKATTRQGETIEIKEDFVYYKKASISSGSITIESHDGSYKIDSLGIKTLFILEKWNVDLLGNKTRVKREKRMEFRRDR